MTPEPGTYTASTASTLDTWQETKYIVYKTDIQSGSPYINLLATNPFFKFQEMRYFNHLNNIDMRFTCPLTYTLSYDTHFDL